MNSKPIESNKHDFSFKKKERLCSKKVIEKLFNEGSSFLFYPLKVNYIFTPLSTSFRAQAAFTVSKKLFKNAVQRNLIKRRMRESYRLNKSIVNFATGEKQVAMFFIFVGKEITSYTVVDTAMKKALKKIVKEFDFK